MSMPPFRRCRLLVKNYILKNRLRRMKTLNMSMENELSFVQGELQQALWQLHEARRTLQYLRAAEDRRRQAATARQRQWRQNRG